MRGGQSNLNVFLLAKSNANNYRDRLSTGYHIRLISPFINSSFTLQRYKINTPFVKFYLIQKTDTC